jgi:hypothetical protein
VHPAARPLAALCATALCATALCACGDTLQSGPIPHNLLEDMIVAPYPVYWLGRSFADMQVSEVTHDPSDAFAIAYGNCVEGGEGACVAPLRIVTSPDNGFLPGGETSARGTRIRGVDALLEQGGKTIVLATGPVVVDIYARSAQTATEAARALAAINAASWPEQRLPAALPNTGFGETPLSSQVPPPLHPLG